MVPPSYGLDAAWLDKAMAASVRFNTASASFVSSSGLLLTNHHVGSDCIQQLALMDEGFVAKTQEEEKRCPSVELAVLRAIEDVTQQVMTSTRGAGSEQAQQLRNAEIARIEKKCTRSSGLYCSVVVLWSGGAYHLYKYKRYTDVRLVFAPELSVAYFGGDRDNFTYPRFCLDVALFRAYENEAPVKTDAHFRLSKAGPSEGDTLYSSGHPKMTDRFARRSKLEMLHSIAYPFLLERYALERDSLRAFSAKGPREEKAARD